MNKFNDIFNEFMGDTPKNEENKVHRINVENTDEIRWTIDNGHLIIEFLNDLDEYTRKLEPLNEIDNVDDYVTTIMTLLELCASEMDKAVKLKHKSYIAKLINEETYGKDKSGRYPWKQKPVCKDCGTPMKHFGEDCENCGCREYIDKWVDTNE